MSLETSALYWLRFVKRCPLVLFERVPRSYCYSRPDVIGVTRSRYMVEIEIKRSMSDFRNNSKKRHVQARESILTRWPRWFYFGVPDSMVEKVVSECPEWAGVIRLDETPNGATGVVKSAPKNDRSSKLTILECARLMENLGNQIVTAEIRLDAMRNRTDLEWGLDFRI